MVTILIIAITGFVSFSAFSNYSLIDRFIFYPPEIKRKQWYRFITSGFVHADWGHLIFNMFSLYLFGQAIETVFKEVFGVPEGIVLYVLLYLTGLVFSILPTYFKEKENDMYRCLGASGAVSSIVFAYILVYPMSYMGIMLVPVMLPAFLFGIIYVIASVYMDKNSQGNINHSAHIAGGLYGIIFMAIVFRAFADINIFEWFIDNIEINSLSDLVHLGY